MSITDKIISGDCEKVLATYEDQFNLILTSPPYADNRKKTYGGIHPDKYVEWFLPKSAQFFRVLKDDGSFILNIKEKVVDGQRHTYVIDLIKALKDQGWLWTEEYIWHKKNCAPGKWPNRFRDSWERCLHFTKNKKFKMNQEAVMVPMGDWAKQRLKNLSETDKQRDNSKVNSGFGKNIKNWVGRTMAYPTNVLHLEDILHLENMMEKYEISGTVEGLIALLETVAPTNVLHLPTECYNREHSAVFPQQLPEWFIKLFTDENDAILDPFAGSGTTGVVAKELNRHFVMIDIHPDYCETIIRRLSKKGLTGFESLVSMGTSGSTQVHPEMKGIENEGQQQHEAGWQQEH